MKIKLLIFCESGGSKILNWYSDCYVFAFFKNERSEHNLFVASAANKILGFILFVLLLSSSFIGFGQTTIWEEYFTYSDGTTTGSGSPPLITSWTADGTTNSRGVEVQNNKLQGYRTKGASGREYWTIDSSDPIEISGYSNVTISINSNTIS